MWRWIVVTGVACALTSNAASAKQIGLPTRANEAIDQSRATPPSGGLGLSDARSAAVVSSSGIDVIAGRTFVGRDPDRHIRFQILRDSKF